MYSNINSIFHFPFFVPDYPASRFTVTGLETVTIYALVLISVRLSRVSFGISPIIHPSYSKPSGI
jgi:hypothetical protein